MLRRAITVFVVLFGASGFCQGTVVISQIYGGGGNSGATYRNDFIELFNRSSNVVAITGWSVQYASAGGTTWQVTVLSGTLPPGRYYLVQEGSGGSNGTNLPPADRAGTVSMSGTAGKVALVSNAVMLAGDCPIPNSAIIDFVGYGSTASCAEGTRAPTHSSMTSLQRAFEGCADTDDNGGDFFAGNVTPRNSASPAHDCNVLPPSYAIHEMQGTNSASPLVGEPVTTTTNIVTALRNNGFFVQTPDGEEDGNALSSEGIFVLTAGPPGTNAQRGHAVVVTGTVIEFRPVNDPASAPRTQINASHIRFVSADNPLPAPVILAHDTVQPDGGPEQLERWEGMRVSASFVVTGPTEGFVDGPNSTATSSGVFYGVLNTLRAFREPGIHVFETLPAGAPCCVPRFDGNPEILRIDSDAQPGAGTLDISPQFVFLDFIGPLYYEARRYTLLPDAESRPQIIILPGPRPPPPPGTNELIIASLNLERFYDTVDDAGADVVLAPAAYSNRLHKAALLLGNVMHRPDIVGLAEVENLRVLGDLATSISNSYAAFLVPGNDPGGINVGFLVNTARVEVLAVAQQGKNATFTHPESGMAATLHDRPPLLLRARIPDTLTTNDVELTIIMNHLRSLLDIADVESGPFVRAKRRGQAEFLARLIQQRQSLGERVMVMGDFNAFEFNDGYVDVMGTILGRPAPVSQVVLGSSDFVNPDLCNLIETLPVSQRYSYLFDGTRQALDHILVSQTLRERIGRFLYARGNADWPEVSRNDPEVPERVSDHDGAMAYVTLGILARIVSLARGSMEVALEGEGTPGRGYDIERSGDLSGWLKIGSAAADQAGRFSFRDLNPVSGAAFYRLRASDQN